MSGRYVLLALMGLIVAPVNAQPAEQFARTFQLDLAVPDAPALLLLEREDDALLRPASVRAAAIAASDFFGASGRLVVPDQLGVEFSPGLLIGGQDLSVSRYRQNPWLYRLRLSVATLRGLDADATSALAIGLRVNTVDRSDLRTNRDYELEATALAEAINNLILIERQQVGPTVPLESIEALPHVQDRKRELIEEFQERWAERRWNERISELALGTRAASPDSLIGHLHFDRLVAWYTSAHPVGPWGQLLVGVSGEAGRMPLEDDFAVSGRGGTRFYIGTNTHKAFLEAAVSLRENDELRWLVNGGVEIRIADNFWLDFRAGARTDPPDGDDARLVTSIRLHFAPPFGGG